MTATTLGLNWVDFTIVGVIIFSAVISIFRGFIKEAVSLVAWGCGMLLSLKYATDFQEFFANWTHSPAVRYFFAFVSIFIGIVIVGMIMNFIIGCLIQKTGLSFIDRSLGFVFGLARGVLIVAVLLLMVANFGSVKETKAIVSSQLAAQFKPLTRWMNDFIPANIKSVTLWVETELKLQREKFHSQSPTKTT